MRATGLSPELPTTDPQAASLTLFFVRRERRNHPGVRVLIPVQPNGRFRARDARVRTNAAPSRPCSVRRQMINYAPDVPGLSLQQRFACCGDAAFSYLHGEVRPPVLLEQHRHIVVADPGFGRGCVQRSLAPLRWRPDSPARGGNTHGLPGVSGYDKQSNNGQTKRLSQMYDRKRLAFGSRAQEPYPIKQRSNNVCPFYAHHGTYRRALPRRAPCTAGTKPESSYCLLGIPASAALLWLHTQV